MLCMKKIDEWVTAPKGFMAAGVKAGLKKSGKHDLAVVFSDVPAAVGAVFTQNVMASPTVFFSRQVAKNDFVRAIVINAGNANACTGEQGFKDASKMAEITTNALGVEKDNVLVCSTGVIGHFLPMDKIEKGINDAVSALSVDGGESTANAIRTTDTFVKSSAYEIVLDGKLVKIAGIAKGSGMIHPNMATMLTFITTDAAIEPKLLKKLTKYVADRSFNMVVVDGDTSTNDTMIVLANGKAENSLIDSESHPDYEVFKEAFLTISQDLAKLIARDGEGATKFLEVKVSGATDFDEAKTVAMSIAKSPLVKTAFFGQDPNWGRIVCATGYSGVKFLPEKVWVSLNGVTIFKDGMSVKADDKKLKEVMAQKDIVVEVNLGNGNEAATVWTCDFSYDYVKINAEYHT